MQPKTVIVSYYSGHRNPVCDMILHIRKSSSRFCYAIYEEESDQFEHSPDNNTEPKWFKINQLAICPEDSFVEYKMGINSSIAYHIAVAWDYCDTIEELGDHLIDELEGLDESINGDPDSKNDPEALEELNALNDLCRKLLML